MKQVTLICDLCNKEIDKVTKYNTLQVPVFAAIHKREWHETEMHFCEEHNILSLTKSLMGWEYKMTGELMNLFTENKWNPKEGVL